MSKAKVLVVEDEGIVAMNTKLSLIGMGYEVLPIAISGSSAIKIALAEKPDVVLMDIRLRGKADGIETTKSLKEKMDVPIIYVTAHTDENTVARANETNPSALLQKPVDDKTLEKAIKKALGSKLSQKRKP
jgi:CheY-like chemotaxis protein